MRRRRLPRAQWRATRLALGAAIGTARRAAGLTQEALGQRLGTKGRSVYRWEHNETAPSERHRRTLIREIHLLNNQAGLKLQAELSRLVGREYRVVAGATAEVPTASTEQVAPSQPAPEASVRATVDVRPDPVAHEQLELAILKLADELDLAPRRARRALSRMFERLGQGNHSFESIRMRLEQLVAAD